MRPTQAHVLKVLSTQAHTAEQEDLADLSGYEIMLRLLSRHKRDLKRIQSNERKAQFKKQVLPDYMPWIKGALEVGSGKQDDILMTWLVWAIDCEEYQLALTLADYALFHDLALPENFNRTLATLIAEEFSDKAQFTEGEQQGYFLAYLLRVKQLTDGHDMPDQSRARLYKAIGQLSLENAPEQALEALNRANKLNPNIGVKTIIKRLQKQLGIS